MSEHSPKKTGLALSGGGLRASFFHIGLFAQMAEQGLLKSIEVISTVSGGSIIGALYYLHLKKLLESKSDKNISDQDYIDIVKTIEITFLKATEKNIYVSVFAEVRKNRKMRDAGYSTSNRIAELYNEYLYQPIIGNLGNPVEMRNLKIQPLDGPDNFHPDLHNGDRKAKVPILVLNATTLNDGQNWEFTERTMGMGESSSRKSHVNIEKKFIRLCRATGDGYQSMVKELQPFPLGLAVAASACIPGLLDPLSVSNLYFDEEEEENKNIVLQLVDGGVFDNQGIESLTKNGCARFIISDASAPIWMNNEVATDRFSVLLRVAQVLQDRVRTECLLNLIDSKGEENIVLIDLRKGLGRREISWIKQDNVPAEKDKVVAPTSDEFGVDAIVLQYLSSMRTHLDAFTEVEAYSLMSAAYKMSKGDLAQLGNARQLPEASWLFTQISPWVESPTPEYLSQLRAATYCEGRALKVFPWLWPLMILYVCILIVGFILFNSLEAIIDRTLNHYYALYMMISAIIFWVLAIYAPQFEKTLPFIKYLNLKSFFGDYFESTGRPVLKAVFAFYHLKFINSLLLAQGRFAKLNKYGTNQRK